MSKFDKIFQAREAEETQETKPVNHKGLDSKRVSRIVQPVSAESAETVVNRGRPRAKRSDPDYIGFTTYIRKDTHMKVKIALLQEGVNQELSVLVEHLLSEWVKEK